MGMDMDIHADVATVAPDRCLLHVEWHGCFPGCGEDFNHGFDLILRFQSAQTCFIKYFMQLAYTGKLLTDLIFIDLENVSLS